jgi:hypothetical protein
LTYHDKRRYNPRKPSFWGNNEFSNQLQEFKRREQELLNKFGGEWHKNGCPMGKVVPL